MGNTTNSKYMEYYEAFLKSRKQYYRAWICSILAYIAYIIVWSIVYRFRRFSALYSQSLWPVAVLGPAAALSPLVSKATTDVRKKYKQLLVWSAMEKVFSDLHLQPDGKFSYAELQAAGLSGDVSAKQNDWFRGKYNGISFEVCDVTQWRFQGRVLIVEVENPFPQRVTVVQKGFPKNEQDTENLQAVTVYNSIFMDTFDCYAENAEKAEEILTPQILKALGIASAVADGKLHITFCGYRVFVSVHDNKDAFEPPLFRKFDLEKEMEKVYIQIRQITDLIETVTVEMHTEKGM